MATPRDNVRTVEICGRSYELEASLGAGIAYRNEFFGRLEKPYRGILADDMLHIYHIAQPTIEEGGKQVANPDYAGNDTEALLRVAWAMAWAAGSTKKRYEKFYDEVAHVGAGVFEEASLYATVVLELGGGIIFRRPTGHEGADATDAAQG